MEYPDQTIVICLGSPWKTNAKFENGLASENYPYTYDIALLNFLFFNVTIPKSKHLKKDLISKLFKIYILPKMLQLHVTQVWVWIT